MITKTTRQPYPIFHRTASENALDYARRVEQSAWARLCYWEACKMRAAVKRWPAERAEQEAYWDSFVD